MSDKKDSRPDADDYATGRPAKDEQMKGLQKAMGTPVRQSTLPPFISRWQMPHDDKETD